MSVGDVLSDKQPIIEELTARLRAVAEGEGDSEQGLGLRIVTVQIKEAVVSSSRLWENLQKPYRSEQERIARVAELDANDVVRQRELEASNLSQTQQIEAARQLEQLRARNEALTFDREAAEAVRRAEREQEDSRALAVMQNETTRHALALERERAADEAEIGRLRLEREYELKRLGLEGELAMAASRAQSAHEHDLLDVERERLRSAVANDQSPAAVQARLVELLPEIVAKLPKPTELRAVTIGGNDSTTVAGLVAELAAVVGALQSALPTRRAD
jgi:hypothetical protein